MKLIIATGKIYRHGIRTLKKGEGDTVYLCTFTNHRVKASGGWTTDYHNIYMPLDDVFQEKFKDAISYEMVKNKDTTPFEADDMAARVIVQGEFSMNIYAGKPSATIYVGEPSQVAVIKNDSPWFYEDEAVIMNEFIKHGPEIFETERDEEDDIDT